ncbi:MAG: HmuY family protein [Odoribacteraceae bacterium]|nr:HmuY family protein [Odoribacteraceae bacterium]
MKKFFVFAGMLALVAAFQACEDDDKVKPEPVEGTYTINASDYTKWVYFSFETGAEVTVTDPATDLSWDVAFHRYDVQTNGGASGSGLGGAIQTTARSFAEVTTLPTTGFTADSVANINYGGMPPAYADGSKNSVLATWIVLDLSTMPPPPPTFSNVVYVVRSASGKRAKMLLTDNTNDEGVSGHVTFSYELEP